LSTGLFCFKHSGNSRISAGSAASFVPSFSRFLHLEQLDFVPQSNRSACHFITLNKRFLSQKLKFPQLFG